MHHDVTIRGVSQTFSCRETESVLAAAIGAGGSPLPVGCRGGGCGVCRVQVLEGQYQTHAMSSEQVSETDQEQGIALACQLFARSALILLPVGRKLSTTPGSAPDLFQRFLARSGARKERVS